MDAAEALPVTLRLRNICLPLTSFNLELDLEVQGRVTAIAGPSGAGKTSLMDLVAGLRRARSALVELEGRVLTDTAKGIQVPSCERRIGYVPQDLALFPHLNVRENVLYGHGRVDGEVDRFSYEHVTEVLEIQPLASRSIEHLSGGEKRRVALARALLAAPRLLLLDEPLANLDAALKAKLLPYLGKVLEEFRLPTLYVTHDPAEAVHLCEEVIVLEAGRCVQRGRPDKILSIGKGFGAM